MVRCSRCGEFHYSLNHECRLIGRWWRPEHGQGESEAKDLYGRSHRQDDVEDALRSAYEERCRRDCEYPSDGSSELARVQPIDGDGRPQKRLSVNISAEIVLHLSADVDCGRETERVAADIWRMRCNARRNRARRRA